MSTGLLKVAERAKRDPDARFNSLAHLVDEVLPGHRDALHDDLKSALNTATIDGPVARRRSPWVGAAAAGLIGFVAAFGARAALGGALRGAPPHAAPAAPREPTAAADEREAAPEPVAAPVEDPAPIAPLADDTPEVAERPEVAEQAEVPEEPPTVQAPPPRRRRRRPAAVERSAEPVEPATPERADPVDRIVGEFPL